MSFSMAAIARWRLPVVACFRWHTRFIPQTANNLTLTGDGVALTGSKSNKQQIRTCHRTAQFAADQGTGHLNWANGGGLVHRLADVDSTTIVEVGAVVHEHARVGPHSRIGSGSVLAPHVIIGSYSTLWYNISLQNCAVGDHCIIHNGVCIGQDGFGFLVDKDGKMVKKPQMLQVKIGDYVEIGANTCIDRGSWRDTTIGHHTKIDNHVQIGHNVVIGHSCMICGQAGLGGSSTLGDYVVLAGKAGVGDHVSIASKVRIAAKSGAAHDITEPGDYAGFPAVPVKEWRKQQVKLRKLGRLPESDC